MKLHATYRLIHQIMDKLFIGRSAKNVKLNIFRKHNIFSRELLKNIVSLLGILPCPLLSLLILILSLHILNLSPFYPHLLPNLSSYKLMSHNKVLKLTKSVVSNITTLVSQCPCLYESSHNPHSKQNFPEIPSSLHSSIDISVISEKN